MKKKENQKRHFMDKVLRVPEEVANGQLKITILGFEKMLIENYIAILEYQDFYIRLKTKMGILNINGFQMAISELNSEDIIVTGMIDSVDFEKNEEIID